MSLILDGDGSISGIDEGIAISGVSTITGDIHITGAIDHVGDEDTRIQFPADNTFSIDTAGSERLRITSGGDVGIGTDNPASILHTVKEGGTFGSLAAFSSQNGDVKLRIDDLSNTATERRLFITHNQSRSGGGFANDDATYGVSNIKFDDGTIVLGTNTSGNTTTQSRLLITSAGEVRISNTDITASTSADELIIGPNSPDGDRGLTIFSGTSGTGNIFFGDTDTSGTGNRMGTIIYDHTGNFMRFSTNGNTERVRVGAAGTVTVYRGTSNTGKTSGQEAFRVGNGGGNFRFSVYPDGSTVIGGTGDISNNNLLLRNDGVIVVASGGGIDFSATADGSGTMSSELLDDYEEGTWTPQLTGSSGGAYTMGGSNAGRYTKIGRMVRLDAVVQWTGGGPYSGNLIITGIPYTPSSSVRSTNVFASISSSSITPSSSSFTWMSIGTDLGSTSLFITQNGSGTQNQTPTVASSGAVFAVSLTYQT